MTASRRVIWIVLALSSIALVPAPPAEGGPIVGWKWASIGPQPDSQFVLAPGGDTGRTTAIAVNPFNPDDVWIGTAGGGVWHSTNGGGLWFPMSDDQASLAIGSLALAGCSAAGCTQVYAGTGENAIRRDTYYGAGLLIGTTDAGGFHWTLDKGQALATDLPNLDFTHGSIYNVVLDPTTAGSSQVLYITLSSGVTASATESTVTAPAPEPGGYGIFKSTNNGVHWDPQAVPGASYTDAGGAFVPGRPTDLEMDPANSLVLYAGFLGRGIFKTTDGGTTWCPLNPGIARPAPCPRLVGFGLPNPGSVQFDHVQIAIDPNNSAHLYASFGLCPDPLIMDCEPMIVETTTGGDSWTVRDAGSTFPTNNGFDPACPRAYTRYMHDLKVSPANPNTLFYTGFHLCRSDSNGTFWASIDSNTKGGILHPDHHAIAIVPGTSPMRMYDANDGGVAESTDGGAHWTPMTNGLNAMEFQSLATSPDTTDVFGGTQDNSGTRWTGSKQWTNLNCCGDGGFSMYETYLVGDLYPKTNMYITSNLNGLSNLDVMPLRSTDWGAHWFDPGDPPVLYDLGLNTTESRSFYPPIISGGGYDMFATDRLYTSVDQFYHWTLRSPPLSSDPETEIFSHADAITAVAVAPSNPTRFYLGYYSGKVFYTDAACSNISCWTQVSNPSGGAPVTWLAVDPASADTVYATVSGFAPGIHVFKTGNKGVTWNPTGSLAELSGVPADTITIDPGAGNVLYLGTDHGVYRSDNSGGSWYRFSSGLPNVPVYAIAADAAHGRLFAATHGRGVYLWSSVFGRTYVEGPIKKLVLDQPVFGGHYLPNASCNLKVLRQDGSVCASGRTDAFGGTIRTDAEGFLGSTRTNYYSNLPVVWACAQGNCLGTDAQRCIQGTSGPAAVEVNCGGAIILVKPPSPSLTPDPPSSGFTIGDLSPGSLGNGGSFLLMPTLQNNDGSSHVLCSVMVPFAPGDSQGTVLQHAMDMLNGDPICMTAGVQAMVDPPVTTGAVEDEFAHPGHLMLTAPNLTGGRLITGFQILPGQAQGVCFDAGELDDTMRGSIRNMKVQFITGPGGATGGMLTLRERSMLGECAIDVPTPAGATPAILAAMVSGAFQTGGMPSPYPGCPTEQNPRDLFAMGDAVHTALASDLVICLNDPGVGASLVPTEVCTTNADCDDANPCTTDSCEPASGVCQHTSVANGTACDDANACTVGTTCQSGQCGTPVTCNDANPCTTDTCDPATGACTNTAIACDDGNPCTTDTCSAATGGCVFSPAPAGTTCSDGDPCTTGDSCVQPPAGGPPTCQGNPACADADPCTADSCDPATGACTNTPIVCDDANPCTDDVCVGGACVSNPIAGAICDDGNLCTTGGSCVPDPASGIPTCQTQPVNCDDANACTIDTCDPTTGGCLHTPVPVPGVPGLMFTGPTTMTWMDVAGAVYYDTYRGTIPMNGMGTRTSPAGPPLYDQSCLEAGDAFGDGTLVTTDATVPPLGTAFYYLTSEVSACFEGPIGTDWNGSLIPNASPCPMP
jgi:hypothetical protein